jgi:aminoglycoside 2''-phosphotransferase
MTDETQKRIDQIEEAFPHRVEGVRICDNGEDFLVIEVNQEWMFRFPRNAPARRALDCEKRFLPRLEKLSPVPVPQIRYSGEDFIGYRKIEGALLTARLFHTLGCEARKRIARQLGGFLSTLHSFPLEQALEMGLTEGWSGWREKAYQSFRENAAPLLSATAREEAIAFLEGFFTLEWKRVVIHGDFYPSDHVFIDEKRQEVSGVIDFGDLTIEDAATDFQSILEDFGEDFLRDVTACYIIEVDAPFLDRIRTRIKARPLFDAAYALEYGFEERFRRRLSEIETVFGGENCA